MEEEKYAGYLAHIFALYFYVLIVLLFPGFEWYTCFGDIFSQNFCILGSELLQPLSVYIIKT